MGLGWVEVRVVPSSETGDVVGVEDGLVHGAICWVAMWDVRGVEETGVFRD